ncbi:MAG: LysR family transcriptional regulator [Tissierellia bacterium]|nr:LysR family transcriptional regulator [Tissierellia bacterium]
MKYKAHVKTQIEGNKRFMGPGPYELLKYLKDENTVKDAAKKMNLSYSKAWKMINLIEKELGEKILDRKSGGSDGGESSLNKIGIELLEKYELYEKKIEKYANDVFEEIFKDFN